jgi:hypothetical protein
MTRAPPQLSPTCVRRPTALNRGTSGFGRRLDIKADPYRNSVWKNRTTSALNFL